MEILIIYNSVLCNVSIICCLAGSDFKNSMYLYDAYIVRTFDIISCQCITTLPFAQCLVCRVFCSCSGSSHTKMKADTSIV